MAKLSIIVPIYNVEQYLKCCVESLCAQDFDDYEIVLVDDGSTDESGWVADQIAGKSDERRGKSVEIRVIHQENGGLSAARNTGIRAAKGNYICFVDSDDYWKPNVLGSLMAQVERENLDILRFNYQNVRNVNGQYELFEPNKVPHIVDYSTDVLDGLTYLNERMGYACYAVLFIIRRSLILTHNVWFTEGIYYEDTDWTPRILLSAKRVNSTSKTVYNYLYRQGSISRSHDESKLRKVIEDKFKLIHSLQKINQVKHCRWIDSEVAGVVLSIITLIATDFWSERDYYLGELAKMKIYPIYSHFATHREQTKMLLINISAYWYCILQRIIRILTH